MKFLEEKKSSTPIVSEERFLSMLVDAGLTKNSYNVVKDTLVSVNIKALPRFEKVFI